MLKNTFRIFTLRPASANFMYYERRAATDFESPKLWKGRCFFSGWNPELVFLTVVFFNSTVSAVLISDTSIFWYSFYSVIKVKLMVMSA